MLTVGEHHVFEWHQASNGQARTSDSFQLINTPLFYYLGLYVDIGVRRPPNQCLVVVSLRSDLEFSRSLSVDLVMPITQRGVKKGGKECRVILTDAE